MSHTPCGVRPLLLQTLVDRPYSGTCYRAANWILVGQTQGRGRMDRTQIVSGDMSRRISDFFRFPEGVLVVHDDAQRLAIWWPTAVGQQKTGRKE